MTARTTFEAAVKTAAATKITAVIAAETTRQGIADASNSVVGYSTINGNYANFAAAVAAGNASKAAAVYAAEVAKQAAVDVARDTLRATGDLSPV
jgi:hypothetical protein